MLEFNPINPLAAKKEWLLNNRDHRKLLVVDGLSTSIFRELVARTERLGWVEMVPAALARPLVGVAAFPTITEVSRATLLCGKLTTGTSSLEKNGFSSHAALLAQSRADAPPRLFHKGDLSDSTNLSNEVRTAIANPHQRVVGLVYNAVDDHLSGPDQLHQRWNLEDLRLFLPILREAREARRVLVITADHGQPAEPPAGGRVFLEDLIAQLNQRFDPAGGFINYYDDAANNQLHLDTARLQSRGHSLKDVAAFLEGPVSYTHLTLPTSDLV